MGKTPAFQFYAADYLADEHVQLMTLEQEGIYIRLLALCWREGSIPSDVNLLSILCKGGSTEAIRVVAERFNQHPTKADRLVHQRLEAEREKQERWREKSAEGGKISAAKRKARVVQPKPNRPAQPKGNSASSFSSSSAFSSNSESLDKTHTQQQPQRVCVSQSKFTLEQIRQYAWASYHLDERLRGAGRKQVDGIRNPDGWAIAAHRSGEHDPLIQEWIDNPKIFELAS
jgi:uncharacterized protein YdaU (DUF1376 family)